MKNEREGTMVGGEQNEVMRELIDSLSDKSLYPF